MYSVLVLFNISIRQYQEVFVNNTQFTPSVLLTRCVFFWFRSDHEYPAKNYKHTSCYICPFYTHFTISPYRWIDPSIITVIRLYLSIYLPSELAGNYIFIYYFSDKVAPHQRNTCQCAIPFFSYKNRYNSLFPVIPPLPPGFLLVVLGFRHASISLRSQRGSSRQVHVSVSSVQCLVPFCFRAQCPVSRFQPRFAFEHQYFLSPLRLSVRRLVYRACLNMSFWFFIGSIALFGWSAY
ncbi:hypothetical protein J3Q64DRAFT_1697063 [Phycomyces blakesleeanus]|uniref:Uncharacterized protein n=2 Tax=Phycomyces blakesleeanus TaxID=4837 RepID=A0A162PN78_PHYB8|nr:hypothetical protein PHYBLDRAFT_67627 [Phycomyces blakesleeanus NRRL 1555(-)]OAD74447.1 hypothetical protein PHYBLDRAFT_67627 [Phycomyces blakesleeanus NRRL 1555(-)]|eukprot:XP_018292487.1 hypothetical protein PHYBLDRAFT_67627 [Phycomyces blakesleeanus NRRL 1555(-)]